MDTDQGDKAAPDGSTAQPLYGRNEMRIKILIACAVVLAIFTSGVIGYRVGNTLKIEDLFQLKIGADMASLSTDVKVAELLKTNQKEKAEEFLENLIDLRVSALSVHAANRKLNPTGKKIIESIHKARDYRLRYTSPTHKINENIKSDLEAAFKL